MATHHTFTIDARTLTFCTVAALALDTPCFLLWQFEGKSRLTTFSPDVEAWGSVPSKESPRRRPRVKKRKIGMPTFKVDAKAETSADPVSLKLDAKKFRLTKSGDVWSGSRDRDLGNNVSISFRASGFFMTSWKLTISFTDPASGAIKKYEKSGNIPQSQLAILNDAFSLV